MFKWLLSKLKSTCCIALLCGWCNAYAEETTEVWRSKVHKSAVRSIVLDQNRRCFASSDDDGEVAVWNIAVDTPVRRVECGRRCLILAISKDTQVLCVSTKSNIQLVRHTDGVRVFELSY